MFSLSLPTEPRWLDLPLGVRVQVRPLTAAVASAAQSYAIRTCRDMQIEQAERIKVGAPIEGLDLADEDARMGVIGELMAIGLAKFGITAWEGIGGEGDGPAEVTPENLEAFGRSGLSTHFVQAYDLPLRALAAEGNASAAGLNGASALAAITAPAASPPAQTAPVH